MIFFIHKIKHHKNVIYLNVFSYLNISNQYKSIVNHSLIIPIHLPLLFSSYNIAFNYHALCLNPHYIVNNFYKSSYLVAYVYNCSFWSAVNFISVSFACNGIPTAMIDDHLVLVLIYSHIVTETAARLLYSCKTPKLAWSLSNCFL